MAASLVAPINDQVEVGVQFLPDAYPGGQPAVLSCEVRDQPEVPVAPENAISVMKWMAAQVPIGLSPVVATLESVANAPGRLADPDVSAAVIMVTDGGDDCLDAPQDEILERLRAAAAKLHDVGVRTYVVWFGDPATQSPEQDAQLAAIAEGGGTAISDPGGQNRVPYIEANDETALNDALSKISDTLASCEVTVEDVGTNADKTRANLYLNGAAIPFDAKVEKADGWGWVDQERTRIELYGKACTSFKTNRTTSIVIEFGCEPVVLL